MSKMVMVSAEKKTTVFSGCQTFSKQLSSKIVLVSSVLTYNEMSERLNLNSFNLRFKEEYLKLNIAPFTEPQIFDIYCNCTSQTIE